MQSNLVAIGIGLVLIGFVLIFIGSLVGAKADSKVAFVGLLGPIPFGFANDKRLFLITLGIAVALIVLWIIFARRLV